MIYQAGFKIGTKVVGVAFDNRQNIVADLNVGEKIWLVREPANPYGSNAIRVERMDGSQFGYINKTLAADLAPGFDQYGAPVEAVVNEIVGGFDAYSNYGVNIEFSVPHSGIAHFEAQPPEDENASTEVANPEIEAPELDSLSPLNKHKSLLLQIFNEDRYSSELSREIIVHNAHKVSERFLNLVGTIFCHIRYHDIEKIVFDATGEFYPEDTENYGWIQPEDKSIVLDFPNLFSYARSLIRDGDRKICLQGALWLLLINTLLDFIFRSRYFNDESWHSQSPEFLNVMPEWRDKKLYELADTYRLTIEPPEIDEEPYFGPLIRSFFDNEIENSNVTWAADQLHMIDEQLMYYDDLSQIAIPTMGGYLINSIQPADVLVNPVRLVVEDENGDEREPFEMPYKYVLPPGKRNNVPDGDPNFKNFEEQNPTEEKESEEKCDGCIPTSGYPYHYPFEYFNPVQSEVFHHKASSNNMIIAANTSAGKTIAAELLVDATLKKNMRVIYLSPLKTLTEEKYTEWQHRYHEETIAIMTGDYELSTEKVKELQASRIIVMTSEMMDSRTRKFESENNQWMKEVGLVVVDESHILTTSRGDAVETGIMRFTSQFPEARILFLSATMPNVGELGDWLTLLNGKTTDLIQSDWRPVKLERHTAEYTDETNYKGRLEYWPTEFKKIKLAVNLILSKPDEKFLAFVHSKNTGHYLLKQLKELDVKVSYHNADLDRRERMRIENSFKDRDNGIRVLVSTSTNAWGVNLPARNVVIVGVHRGLEIVDGLDIIQMAGRAGRYKIDTEGHVYLIVPANGADFWENIFSNPRPVTSVLNDRRKLAFHVLAEIYRKVIQTESDLFRWYERSLAFRQGRMPFSKIEAEAVLQDLMQRNMIHEEDGRLQITGLGMTSAVMYHSPYDIYAWYKNFKSVFNNNLENNDDVVAWAIGTIPKYRSYVPKEYASLTDRWKSIFMDSGLYFDYKTVLYMEAAYNCLRGKKAKGILRSRMVEIKNDAQRIISTLHMIDERYAHWNQKSFWENLESSFDSLNKNQPPKEKRSATDNSPDSPGAGNNTGNQQHEHVASKTSEIHAVKQDYDEADDWGDADWAGYLGCDEDELDQYFDSQM